MDKKEVLHDVIEVLNEELLRTSERYRNHPKDVHLEGQVAGLITAIMKVEEMLEEVSC